MAFTLLLAVTAGPARAQERYVIPRLAATIQLDGLSEEPAWQAITPLPLTMSQPTFGAAPSERTEIRVAHDDDYLYVAGRMYDSDPAGLRATSLKRDDGALSNDWLAIWLDTFNDKENTVGFATTPAGIRTDIVFNNDATTAPNFSWNAFWDVAVQKNADGWFAEMRIPFSSLRFEEWDGRVVMGMIVWRSIARKNEFDVFPAIPPKWAFAVVKASQAREVELHGVRARRPVYATPYGLGGLGLTHQLNTPGTAYLRQDDPVREAGFDLKYGLTSNLTLDLTANTDFAQVEADDQQVNLTRFSLFFPEKRLFFQERASVFDVSTGGDDRLFYSRRIGLVQGRQVRLLGGSRVVGRVGGWDMGLLDMETGASGTFAAENLGVLRVRRQVVNANSYLGGIVTSRLGGGGRHNIAYGADAILRLFGQDYLSLNWAQTFDDEDQGSLSLWTRTLTRAQWERRGLYGLAYSASAARAGRSFDPELGFIQRTDYTRFGDRIAYGWRPPDSSKVLRYGVALNGVVYRRNADGSSESEELRPEWFVTTKIGHTVTVGGVMNYDDLKQPFVLSGGVTVPAGRYRYFGANVNYSPPDGAVFRPTLNVQAGSFYDGWKTTASVTPTWNVSRRLTLSGRYQIDRVVFGQRGDRFTGHLARIRAQSTLSTSFSMLGFVQYGSATDRVTANFRLRYNPREGVDLYLVYNEIFNSDRYGASPVLPLTDARTILLKYSHTLNLGL